MSFNPDLNKQAQEVMFSRKLNEPSHPKIAFNSAPFVSADWQKHLGMYLDKDLNFNLHIKEKMSKAMKGIGVIQKLNKTLPCHSVIERIQYKAALAITGAIKGESQSKLYSELDFKSLKSRRWFRKLCTFSKPKTSGLPEYLFDLLPQNNHLYDNCFLGRCYNIL